MVVAIAVVLMVVLFLVVAAPSHFPRSPLLWMWFVAVPPAGPTTKNAPVPEAHWLLAASRCFPVGPGSLADPKGLFVELVHHVYVQTRFLCNPPQTFLNTSATFGGFDLVQVFGAVHPVRQAWRGPVHKFDPNATFQ